MSWKETVPTALERHPAIQRSISKKLQSRAERRLGYALITPRFDATLSYTRRADASSDSRARFGGDFYNYYDGQISATQTLLQRGFFSGLSMAYQSLDKADLELEAQVQSLTVEVLKATFQVMVLQRKISILRKAEELRKQSLKISEHHLRIGRAQHVDSLQIETGLALLQEKIALAQSDFTIAVKTLSNLLKVENPEIVEQALPEPAREAVQKILEEAPYHNLQLALIDINRQSLDEELVVRMGKYWPRLTGSASFGRSGLSVDALKESSSNAWSFGVSLSVPAFQGLSFWFDHQATSAIAAAADAERSQKVDEVNLELVSRRELWKSAAQRLSLSQKTFSLAQETVKLARKDYQSALIDTLKLLSTEESSLDAEIAADAARLTYLETTLAWAQTKGLPSAAMLSLLQ